MQSKFTVPFLDENDATYYFPLSQWKEEYGKPPDTQDEVTIQLSERDLLTAERSYSRAARALIAKILAGECCSVTVRKESWRSGYEKPDDENIRAAERRLAQAASLRSGSQDSESGPHPSNWDNPLETGKFLVGAEKLVTILCQHLFPVYGPNNPIEPVRGLLIFAGQTGSGKSELLRRFLIRYLRNLKADRKPPHLLTFEDPIESKLWSTEDMNCWIEQGSVFPIDYTPRQRKLDATSLEEVINAALRQTPAALYVGETRHPDDWKHILRFAGTGHLIVTTSHAGSLTECIDGLLRACDASTPAGRSEIASRIFGIVHVRAHRLPDGRETIDREGKKAVTDVKCQIPAVWRRTILGQKLLMSEGLSAITPGYSENKDAQLFAFGRTHFANQILNQVTEGEGLSVNGKKQELFRLCRTWDLAGE